MMFILLDEKINLNISTSARLMDFNTIKIGQLIVWDHFRIQAKRCRLWS